MNEVILKTDKELIIYDVRWYVTLFAQSKNEIIKLKRKISLPKNYLDI